ncbi:hypothetical protein [Kitasatospora sp. DSM 101779]|jgi:hypothetical protein|uniref:hypothetical protein n=1 Tax=Kitasatospora sp. DSM 101779 TaxID=2853165 RepID=UPI0021DB7DBC|nr:hypothetical protein [Kitasatospora sp. DSM 101779]MCU7820245.1 hypothetical protein [Kitasatospora sp. DSM 101779]
MDYLHNLVSGALGQDSALQRLAEEASAGQTEPSARTRQRLELALEDARERDPGFAEALERAVARVQAVSEPTSGSQVLTGSTFSGPTAVQVGDHNRQDNTFGA